MLSPSACCPCVAAMRVACSRSNRMATATSPAPPRAAMGREALAPCCCTQRPATATTCRRLRHKVGAGGERGRRTGGLLPLHRPGEAFRGGAVPCRGSEYACAERGVRSQSAHSAQAHSVICTPPVPAEAVRMRMCTLHALLRPVRARTQDGLRRCAAGLCGPL